MEEYIIQDYVWRKWILCNQETKLEVWCIMYRQWTWWSATTETKLEVWEPNEETKGVLCCGLVDFFMSEETKMSSVNQKLVDLLLVFQENLLQMECLDIWIWHLLLHGEIIVLHWKKFFKSCNNIRIGSAWSTIIINQANWTVPVYCHSDLHKKEGTILSESWIWNICRTKY